MWTIFAFNTYKALTQTLTFVGDVMCVFLTRREMYLENRNEYERFIIQLLMKVMHIHLLMLLLALQVTVFSD